MKADVLYKIHDHIDCAVLMNIARYLYYHGIDITPHSICEKNFPCNITILPTMRFKQRYVVGLVEIVNLYESLYHITNLINKTMLFVSYNPKYRINDRSTHKNITHVPLY